MQKNDLSYSISISKPTFLSVQQRDSKSPTFDNLNEIGSFKNSANQYL